MLQGKSPPLRQHQSCLLDEDTVTVPIFSISGHSLSAEMTCPGTGNLEPKAELPFWGKFSYNGFYRKQHLFPLQGSPPLTYCRILKRALTYKQSVKTDEEQNGLF